MCFFESVTLDTKLTLPVNSKKFIQTYLLLIGQPQLLRGRKRRCARTAITNDVPVLILKSLAQNFWIYIPFSQILKFQL